MTVRILVGDVRERLAELPDNSVQCVVTSPPYFGLRKYLPAGHADEQYELGSEPTLAAYIATMVDVFREVRRVLRPDGTCWLNIGDSHASAWPAPNTRRNIIDNPMSGGKRGPQRQSKLSDGLKEKDLMMVPARLAIALCDDGWYLRSDIIWHKRAPMPESVTDRPTSAHEHIFLLTKQPRYFYDQEAVREDGPGSHPRGMNASIIKERNDNGRIIFETPENGRNQRNVWTVSPEPFPSAHFAVFPSEIPRRCIKAGTSERGACAACGAPWRRVTSRDSEQPIVAGSEIDRYGNGEFGVHRKVCGQYQKWLDTNPKQTTGWEQSCACDADVVPCLVLDPFFGAGTTGLVSDELGRDCIGIELNREYSEMARNRIYGAAPMFAAVEVS